MPVPLVSVVSAVYNGERYLRESLESVLSQQGVDLEFIVVDDGSTDSTPAILADSSTRDSRLRILTQENRGLTVALIRGCAEARGELIARHDAGDVSLPGRLIRQTEMLLGNSGAAMVSCGTRFLGPEMEALFEVRQDPTTATPLLRTRDGRRLRGPSHHGATMFRRNAYESAGGYREEFYFAQDLDLWVRLAEVGEHIVMPEILYEASVTLSSVSQRHRREQRAATRVIAKCAARRSAGQAEGPILELAWKIRPSRASRTGGLATARAQRRSR
jgi:glycosyltransferase involved in cell wall biosynthesis